MGDSIEAVNEFLLSKGMTDGLPIIPPTEDRVRSFLEYLHKEPQEVIASLPSAYGAATVEKIAINAVMAGCESKYMPVLLAAIEAMAEPQFNLNGIQCTTNPAGPMIIINGPIRHALNLNCSSGLMGPGWRANATIGRAIRLILLNVGGAVPGTVDKATQGWPGKYTLCIGENEEDNPWEPLHVERGFSRDESTVTVTGVQGTTSIVEGSPNEKDILRTLQFSMISIGCNNFVLGLGEPCLLISPMHAMLIKHTFTSKNAFKQYLWEHLRAPVEWFSERSKERDGFWDRVADAAVPMIPRWEDYMIVVGGGPGNHSTFLPTFGDTMSVTRRIVA